LRLLEIQAYGVKSIDALSLNLLDESEGSDHPRPRVIYGGNGLGKTTILESMSLLSYLPFMRRLELRSDSGNVEYPAAKGWGLWAYVAWDQDEQVRMDQHEAEGRPGSPERPSGWSREWAKKLTTEHAKEEWKALLENFVEKGHFPIGGGPGCLLYELKFDLDGREAPEPLRFAVLLNIPEESSITRLLGRTTLDERLMYQEVQLQDHMMVVFPYWQRDRMDALIEHLGATAPFIVRGERRLPQRKAKSKKADAETRKEVPPRKSGRFHHFDAVRGSASGGGIGPIVVYINTDLNDFGIRNDVRESPKDLFGDFVAEIVERLGLPFVQKKGLVGGRRRFAKFGKLKKILRRVLGSENAPFELATCDLVRSDDGEWKFDLSVRRGKKEVELDYLSAGENEVFFVFLLLLGLPVQDGIVLVDEPDLHVHFGKQRAFHQELYRLARRLNVQLVVSSHSPFALAPIKQGSSERPVPFFLDRGIEEDGSPGRIETAFEMKHAGEMVWEAGLAIHELLQVMVSLSRVTDTDESLHEFIELTQRHIRRIRNAVRKAERGS
jgi:hypothetical protein